MIKLIRLEWKKNNIASYIRYAAVLAALLGVFLYALAFWGIANDPDGTLDAAEGMNVISSPVELFTGIAFLIFTSAMLASFIVSAYKNKTMNLMFSSHPDTKINQQLCHGQRREIKEPYRKHLRRQYLLSFNRIRKH